MGSDNDGPGGVALIRRNHATFVVGRLQFLHLTFYSFSL